MAAKNRLSDTMQSSGVAQGMKISAGGVKRLGRGPGIALRRLAGGSVPWISNRVFQSNQELV